MTEDLRSFLKKAIEKEEKLYIEYRQDAIEYRNSAVEADRLADQHIARSKELKSLLGSEE